MLDLIRGFALFGVLIVNLLGFFRISLFTFILHADTEGGWVSHAIDLLVAKLIEFKAFDLFSFTFGIGVAIQFERAARRGVQVEFFLFRRFLILLFFGACHMVLVANVDILCLYAVCGLLLIPVLRLPAAFLALAGLAAIYLPGWYSIDLPPQPALLEHAAAATHIYGQGGFWEILIFRWHETRDLIAPILIDSAQNTYGLMLLGAAVWRAGIVREPQRFRSALIAVFAGAGVVGLVNSTAHVPWLRELGSHVLLAFAYAAGLLVWRRSARASAILTPVAAAGRMALTNYLTQSLVFSMLFYGYGFGLFGRLTTAPAALLGVAVYAGQLWFSTWWFRRYRFGPFEWLWRSLTYGRRLPLRQ